MGGPARKCTAPSSSKAAKESMPWMADGQAAVDLAAARPSPSSSYPCCLQARRVVLCSVCYVTHPNQITITHHPSHSLRTSRAIPAPFPRPAQPHQKPGAPMPRPLDCLLRPLPFTHPHPFHHCISAAAARSHHPSPDDSSTQAHHAPKWR
jgi:hypothetical protein